jgi:hypothetical protein
MTTTPKIIDVTVQFTQTPGSVHLAKVRRHNRRESLVHSTTDDLYGHGTHLRHRSHGAGYRHNPYFGPTYKWCVTESGTNM